MNDKKKNPFEGIFALVTDDNLLRENGLLYAENKQLQSNWNSLREWLEQQYAIVKSNSIQEPSNSEWYIKWNERKHVLDKMNELEGKNKDNGR